jgi:hypothetical protein
LSVCPGGTLAIQSQIGTPGRGLEARDDLAGAWTKTGRSGIERLPYATAAGYGAHAERPIDDRMTRPLGRSLGLAWLPVALALATTPASASATTSSDPAANRKLNPATYSSCSANPVSSGCISSALADINAARAAEGVPPMTLPSNFASMTVPVQLLNLANLERVDRGLSPILGLSVALDRDAQAAAAEDRDPMPTDFYGNEATSNWAAGYPSALEADFEWMYDDGLGSANLDCTASDRTGCWGHRNDILWHFSAPVAMGAGYATAQYGPSMTELFVGGDTRAAPGQPDAPVVTPTQPAAGGSEGASGTVAGHSAAASPPRPQAWAARPRTAGGTVHVTVGCRGPRGSQCRVTVELAGTRTPRTVVIATGHSTVVGLSLDRAHRRQLAANHRLHARLTIDQTASARRPVRVLSLTLTFH